MISIEEWRGRIGSFKNVKNNSQGNETDFDIQLREKCILSINQTLRMLAVIRRLLVIGGIETNPGPQTTLSYGNKDYLIYYDIKEKAILL